MAPVVPKWKLVITLSGPQAARSEVLYDSENPTHAEFLIGFAIVVWTEDSSRFALFVQGAPGPRVLFGRNLRTSSQMNEDEAFALVRAEMRKQYPEIPTHVDPVKEWAQTMDSAEAYRKRHRQRP